MFLPVVSDGYFDVSPITPIQSLLRVWRKTSADFNEVEVSLIYSTS